MAIDSWRPETDAWISPQKTFYQTSIHIGHDQLRHLISSPSPNVIYFVDGKKVCCLDTTTNTRILITELLFDAICTASGHGWFCAGGKTLGYFAAMRIPELYGSDDPDGHRSDCPHRPSILSQLEDFYHALPPRVRIERLGEQIVNSISIHRLQSPGNRDADDVVAILTNNDQTVRIYSLTRDVEIRAEKFDFAMNHATISPSGSILMIVGDKEVAYFYKKIDKLVDETDGQATGNVDSQHGSWTLLRQVRLHKPLQLDSSAYFTTAWSSTGRFCATASENGAIMLLDTEALEDEDRDPVMTVIRSSRPESIHGGVRAMCFAPHPWDLLLWNEDSGRMCVADLRNTLRTRQIIELDHTSGMVTKIEPTESSLSTRPQRGSDVVRYAEMLSQTTTQAAAQRSRFSQRHGVPSQGVELQGLTDEEQQILDNLRIARQRDEALRTGDNTTTVAPRSINYSVPRTRAHRQAVQDSLVLGSIRTYLQDQTWLTSGGSHARHNNPGRMLDNTNPDPWRVIEAAMASSQVPITPDRINTSNYVSSITDNDTDELTIVPNPLSTDPPSPRTPMTLPNIRQMGDSGRSDSEAAFRDYRQRVAEADAANSWRARTAQLSATGAALAGRLAEFEAEIEETERRRVSNGALMQAVESETAAVRRRLDADLQAVNASAARLLATGLTAFERTGDTRSRPIDLTTTSAEVNLERRRRIREASLRMPVTLSSPRESGLTTRGEAVLAREQRERENRREQREQERERDRTDTSTVPYIDALREDRDMTLQALRSLRRRTGGEETMRRSRMRGLRSGTLGADDGLWTTGIAWGDASTVYVGTEEGIFELKLNFEERKFWPATERR